MLVVTGGSGFIGSRVARRASHGGRRVRVVSRKGELPQELRDADVEGARGDVQDRASLVRAFEGAEAVVHLVGIIVERRDATFEGVHHRGTENALDAAADAGIRRFVHMSALGTRPDAASRYHRTKWAAEEAVRRSGLDWTVHRPSVVYGRGDGFVSRFNRMLRFSPVVPVPGDGSSRLQPVPVEDVATAFVQSVDDPGTIGKTFTLCGPRPLTLDQVLDRLMETTGRRRPRWHVPLRLLEANAAVLEKLLPVPPLTRDQLRMLREDNVGDPSAMRETFDVELPEFEEGLRRMLR